MNKLYLLLVVLCYSSVLSAQSGSFSTSRPTAIDARITEVYGDQAQHLAGNSNLIQSFTQLLNERVEFKEVKQDLKEKFPKLSEVPLFNKYNPDLKRDDVVDKATFNVLKYKMRFFANYDVVYRVDNTDTVIIIRSQKRK